ncbi:MAG: tyrosine-type recombinase/integrase, partial [Acidimicrobiia bacterium]|nr:tyrosine-type recombinase/integrase [Acidimicrobiia bacterium]
MASSRPFGNIRKLKSGRYQARYWRLGKQIPAHTTFATKAEARAWLSTMESDLLAGRHVDPSNGRERYGDFAARWLEQRDLRPRTRETYISQIEHILDEFEAIELRRISPSAVRAWHSNLSQSGLHANTVAKIYRLFRTTMDTAVEDGIIRTNPVHIKGAAVERAVERPILEWEDVRRIAESINPRFSALVWVGAMSGLRFGELTGLMRRHVDVEHRTLRVDQALMFVRGQGPTLGPPKSAAAHRTVVIPASAMMLLADHMQAYTEDEVDALVFTSVKDSPLLNRYFSPFWKRALSNAGANKETRFHDLRHLAGTSAATAGASVREIMARM